MHVPHPVPMGSKKAKPVNRREIPAGEVKADISNPAWKRVGAKPPCSLLESWRLATTHHMSNKRRCLRKASKDAEANVVTLAVLVEYSTKPYSVASLHYEK